MMLTSNPYDNRKAVTNPSEFYDRRRDIVRVVKWISSQQSCCILGEPRIGKTSLLYYLAHPNGAIKLPEVNQLLGDPNMYLFVLVELQRLPTRDAFGLWRYLFDRLSEETRKANRESKEMRTYYDESRKSGDIYQIQIGLEQYLEKLSGNVVVLFDDFDIAINNFEKDDVLSLTHKLRALAQRDELNYVIATTDSPVQLFEDRGLYEDESPLLNILYFESLALLDENGADLLIRDPLRKVDAEVPEFTDQDVGFVRRLAGRHPDLIKVSCFYLFEAKLQGHVDYDRIRQTIEHDQHVRWLMNRLWNRVKEADNREGLALSNALLSIAKGVEPADSRALDELRERGLVDTSTSPPQVFGDIFRGFILREGAGVHQAVAMSIPRSIELKPENRKVRIDGNELVLAPLEFRLLRYLAENAGRTCTRKELREAVWGDNPPTSRDALEQLVRRIRGKIEPDPKRPQRLLAVRGQGYLFRAGATS